MSANPDPSASPELSAHTDRWEAVLEELETALDDAARAMSPAAAETAAETLTAWRPPAGLGPLPAHLETRARDLLQNQRTLVGQLQAARKVTAQHLSAVRSVPPARSTAASVYLDVAG